MSQRELSVITVRSIKERKYARIPVNKITVVNSRDREQRQFAENVSSIGNVGLLKPVVVNERFRERTGHYELVCGEGRLLAYKKLGKSEIEAELIDVDRKQAHLMSLIENIARVSPGSVWFAREVTRMHQSGMSVQEIARIVGKSESYVSSYIHLAENGELRLLRGVEQGLFPMTFARRVAESGGKDIQNILMDAYDGDVITTDNFTPIKRILSSRMAEIDHGDHASKDHPRSKYSVKQLKRDITKVTREKETYVKEAERKENRLFSMLNAIEILTQIPEFADLLKNEGLAERPKLSGSCAGATSPAPIMENPDEEQRNEGS